MEFTAHLILAIGAMLLVSVLASRVTDRIGAPLLLVFLVMGMLLGEDGPGGIVFNDIDLAFVLASLALAVILFDGGLRTPRETFRLGLQPAAVLATVGVLVTAGITGIAAIPLFDLHPLEGLLIGAIVASTDAAAVFYLLHAHGLRINDRLQSTLEIESGSNDPMAVFLTLAMVELLRVDGGANVAWLLAWFAWQIGMGALLGAAGGRAVAGLVNRVTLAESFYPVLVLAGGLTLFGLAATLDSSGFLAAYVGGVVAGNSMRRARYGVRRFHDGMAWLSQAGLFLMLGLLVTPSQLLPLALPSLALAAILILIARPAAVALCLWPFGFPVREQAFIAWVGLRGAVPIVLGLYPLLAGTAESRTAFNVAFFLVLISLIVQGWTTAPAARWLRLQLPPRASGKRLIELDAPGLQEHELVVYRVVPQAPAAGTPMRSLPLPTHVRLITVVRDNKALGPLDNETLAADDHVYLLARESDLPDLESLFGIERDDRSEHRAFGDFTLRGDANLGEVCSVYGIDLPEAQARQTLAQFLHGRLGRRLTVGDRTWLGPLELIVRRLENERVQEVGLRIREVPSSTARSE